MQVATAPSRNTSEVGEARTPILSMLRPTESPGASFSTRNTPSSFSPVRAKTVKKSATGADVIHVF